MTFASLVETMAPLVAVLAPIVGAPLTVMTFYLRSLRENFVFGQSTLIRRIEALEASSHELRKIMTDLPRDYTTKEEWLRELLHARRVLEDLTKVTARLQATLDETTKRRNVQSSKQGGSRGDGTRVHAISDSEDA